jgi:hypothetical protein
MEETRTCEARDLEELEEIKTESNHNNDERKELIMKGPRALRTPAQQSLQVSQILHPARWPLATTTTYF